MREYDEHIRLYTPILQRIIILVAVIIAVPVVLWTITAFVRAYVAPPQLPIFRPITAASQTPTQQTQDSAVQVAAQTADTTTASDARGPLLDIRKPSDSAPAANSPAPPPATQQIASTTAAASPSAAPGAPMSAPSTSAAPPAPAGVPPPPFAASHSLPLTTAAPTNVALANVAPPPAPAVAWPNPAINAPANSGSNAPSTNTVASQEQTATNDSTTDDLPPGVPLKGKIPLPRHRPNVAALTNLAFASGPLPGAMLPGSIPLPRARPASAPAEPAPVSATSYPSYYDPSNIH